ncbi:protoporphyrinogen/coproporphyrinogen oxidase [Streptomyces djakartensis]|uniref:protoporphyrinogen/coproporphyrinogen oxidase n=1 Tax=Streptomyces djakartensis TaxID=68193 RepID=UPI0034DF22A0
MHSSDSEKSVVVIGAGIAGLAAAFRLQRAGFAVRILEAENHVGGRMTTQSVGDYRIDLGACWLPTSYKEMTRLITDAKLEQCVRKTADTYSMNRHGITHRLRTSAKSDLLRSGLLSIPAKASLARLLFDMRAAEFMRDWSNMAGAADYDAETAYAYAHRKLPKELLDYIVDPLCSGWFFQDSERVSFAGLVFAVKAMLGVSLFNFDGGIDGLPQRLAADQSVQLGARVTSVDKTQHGAAIAWQDCDGVKHTEDADGCVIAVQGVHVPSIYSDLNSEGQAFFSSLRYTRDVHVTFGTRGRPSESVPLILIPTRVHADLSMTSILLHHNNAPGRAPDGKGLIGLYFTNDEWNDRCWSLDDATVVENALEELRTVRPDLAAFIETRVEMSHVQRWPIAIVKRNAGDFGRVRQFTESLSDEDQVQLAGDYFSVSTTNASLASGERAARNLIHSLRQ